MVLHGFIGRDDRGRLKKGQEGVEGKECRRLADEEDEALT